MKHTIREAVTSAHNPPKVGRILLNPFRRAKRRAGAPTTFREKLYWTLGNLLMLIGAILLAYVGGIYAQADYNRYAARGDTDAPPPAPVAAPRAPDAELAPYGVARTMMRYLNLSGPRSGQQVISVTISSLVGAM